MMKWTWCLLIAAALLCCFALAAASPPSPEATLSPVLTEPCTSTLTIEGCGTVCVDGWCYEGPVSDIELTDGVFTLEAIPCSGWQFDNWSGDLTGSANPTTITMDACKSVTASFSQAQCTLVLTGVGSGSVLVDGLLHSLPWSGDFPRGSSVALEAVPDGCYQFDNWSGDVIGDTNPTTITMDADKSVTANFSQAQCTLSLTAVGSGQVRVNGTLRALPWSDSFACGTVVCIEAVPGAGWSFVNWSGELSGNANPIFIELDELHCHMIVVASFASGVDCTLIVTSTGSGEVRVDGAPRALPWSGMFPMGAIVALEAIPESCWEFDLWLGDVVSTTNPVTIVMDSDMTVTARFLSALDFADVGCDNWAHDEVEACFKADIVKGYPDGLYHPEFPVTRDQMAVYISRAMAGGDDNVPSARFYLPSFRDVPFGYWAYRYIGYLAANGVTGGYDGRNYWPQAEVTRDQMAVYLARAMVAPGGDAAIPDPPATASFADVPTTFWAYKQVEYCVGQGVVKGYDDGLYKPERKVTRDQMAVYIAKAFGLL